MTWHSVAKSSCKHHDQDNSKVHTTGVFSSTSVLNSGTPLIAIVTNIPPVAPQKKREGTHLDC